MKIQIQIVTWNSADVIESALASIEKLQIKPHRILVIDNNSIDDTKKIATSFNCVQFIQMQENIGFSGGHNIGFKHGLDCDGVLCVNPDVVLFKDALETITDTYISQPHPATIGGKLYRKPSLTNDSKISIVDTAGIARHLHFQFTDIGASCVESDDLLKDREVFANSGACLFLPISTIKTFSLSENKDEIELFDNDYFAYKEDIDLGWRILKAKKNNINTGKAVGTHIRKIKKEFAFAQRSDTHILLSYRNHLLLLSKNLSTREKFQYGIFIIAYELIKFFYLLMTHPKTLVSALKEFWSIKKKK